tara:strand:+ start:774 stop:1178 length:405 start_codon:yes stop_codon:yes gene_type:complete
MVSRASGILVVTCALLGCSKEHLSNERVFAPKEILESPALLDGKVVTVSGYVESAFERYRIWDTKQNAVSEMPGADCINVSFRGDLDLLAINERYAEISGRFVAEVSDDIVVSSPCSNRSLLIMGPDSTARLVK